MQSLERRSRIGRRTAVALLVPALLAGTTIPGRAEDGGFFGFLASLGGGGAPAPAPAVTPGAPLRPLTVRPTSRRRPADRAAIVGRKPGAARAWLGRSKPAPVAGKTGPVSIYDDHTLRDGDAVMTQTGMRVFAGGRVSPDRSYTDANFIAVPAAKSVNPSLKKALTEINKLPHS